MPKSLLSFIAVLSLWTVTAPAQDATPEKPKTDESQPGEKKPAADSGKGKSDDAKPSDKKSADDPDKPKSDDSKPRQRKSYVRKASASDTPLDPIETPAPKRGFFSRVFGPSRKATPKPSPTPAAATPAPKVRRRRPIEKHTDSESPSESLNDGTKANAENKVDAEKKGEGEKKPESRKPEPKKSDGDKKADGEKKPDEKNAGPEKKSVTEKPADKKPGDKKPADKKVAVTTPTPAPASTPAPHVFSRKHKGGKPEATPAPESSGPVDPETAERNRFEQVKARALEDPQVQKLKTEADSAITDEEGKKALRAYNKALFNKMRRLDGSLKDRIDITESVILKHLDE
jgi:hypothetical protein